MKKYSVIYADPPWSYNDKMSGHSFSLDHEYETQSLGWIKSLPIQEITEKDAVLFLWAVSPLLPEAFEVITAWGFKFKTLAFCWVKETPLLGVTVSNLGRWTMGGVELCLLATKGKPRRVVANVKQVVHEIRTSHSKKPHQVRLNIEKLMGGGSTKIELFARQKYDGWDAWSNEVESDIELLNSQNGEVRG